MADDKAGAPQTLRSRLEAVSLAGWITLGTFAVLASLTLLAWLLAWRNPVWVPFGTYFTVVRAIVLTATAVVACVAEYLVLRSWFDEVPLPDPDLQAGWESGLRSLRQSGIKLSSRPCVLVLDPLGDCENWFDAAGVKAQRHGLSAESAVQWYAAEGTLYLVVRGLGWSGSLAGALAEIRRRPSRYVVSSVSHATKPEAVAVATGVPDVGEGPLAGSEDPESPYATIDPEAVRAELLGLPVPQPGDGLVDAGDLDDSVAGPESVELTELSISSEEIVRESRRLASISRRLRGCRRPVAPLNGVCVLLPMDVVTGTDGAGARLGEALRHDLRLVEHEAEISAPISVVLTGAEEHAGVPELIRRTASDEVHRGDFGLLPGAGRATSRYVADFTRALGDRLQQRVGRALRDPRWVGRPGADRLYRLLADLRGDHGREVTHLVEQAFSPDEDARESVLAGVSLAATGSDPTRRGFARFGVRHLVDGQDFVEWTDRGLRNEDRLWWAAGTLGTLSVAAVVALLWMLTTTR